MNPAHESYLMGSLFTVISIIIAFAAGYGSAALERWFRQRSIKKAAAQNMVADEGPSLGEPWLVNPKKTTKCPVETCNIQGPHSHVDALVKKIKDK